MADDIVVLLRELMSYGTFPEDSVYGKAVLDAADEIERLRVAGDVIAGVLAALVGDRKDVQRLLDGWEEARRG